MREARGGFGETVVACERGAPAACGRIVGESPRPCQMPTARYAARSLIAFARALLERAGIRADIAEDVAEVLVAGDLLGHTTHGLALLAGYLGEIEKGSMTKAGEPAVVNARPATQTWDGGRLPGPWLTLRALEAAATMAATHGSGTVVIRRSHHIACLAAYLLRATERGLVAIIESSDPIVAAVVPHGGRTPFITPNPIAAGLPTSGDPILIDVSTSITSMGFARQRMEAGERLPGAWAIDAEGRATDDPGVLWKEPKGALLPLGGIDAGHKGFGLGLLIEAMTAGLAGFGRCDPKEGWGATVFVQVLDPEAFAGRASSGCGYPAKRVCGAIASSRRTASRCIRRSCRRSSPGRKSLGL